MIDGLGARSLLAIQRSSRRGTEPAVDAVVGALRRMPWAPRAVESPRLPGYRGAMLAEHFAAVLWVTGAFTATPLLQYIAPKQVLARLYHIELTDEAGLFFARHWGIVVAAVAGLLMFAAVHPELRPAVVTAALIEKAGIIVAYAMARHRPFARGLRLVVVFDSACVIVYALWLATS